MLRELINGNFKVEWEPKDGDTVYIMNPVRRLGYMIRPWDPEDDGHTASRERGLVFRTKEEAEEKAYKLGWYDITGLGEEER